MKCAYIAIALGLVVSVKSFSGHYEVIPEYFEFPMGKNDKLVDPGTIRPKKFNRTTYTINGDLELLRPLSDELNYHFSIYVLQGNEYRQYSMRKTNEICTSTIRYKEMAGDFFEHTNLPSDYTCPIPAGKYWIKDFSMQNQMLIVQPPNGDKFRINYTFFDGDEMISASAFYVTLNKAPVF